jgi:hypothetical protein
MRCGHRRALSHITVVANYCRLILEARIALIVHRFSSNVGIGALEDNRDWKASLEDDSSS